MSDILDGISEASAGRSLASRTGTITVAQMKAKILLTVQWRRELGPPEPTQQFRLRLFRCCQVNLVRRLVGLLTLAMFPYVLPVFVCDGRSPEFSMVTLKVVTRFPYPDAGLVCRDCKREFRTTRNPLKADSSIRKGSVVRSSGSIFMPTTLEPLACCHSLVQVPPKSNQCFRIC